jgi:manganese efflux pump family protein
LLPSGHLLEALALGLAMSVDGFAAAVALGSLGLRKRHLRVAAALGGAAFLFPVAGILLGTALSGLQARVAEWAGIGALVALGGWTLLRARREASPGDSSRMRPSAGAFGLLLLAASLSMDNLVIGLGLGLHGRGSWLVGAAAGLFTFTAALLGLRMGVAGRRQWGTRATHAAGVLLLLIAALLATGVI